MSNISNEQINNNVIKLDWFDKNDQKDLSTYLCKICNGIYNNPVLLSCGHIICKECYKINNKKCLMCGENNISIKSENLPFITSYLSKKVCKCKNENCDKKFSINNILPHLKECPKEQILCRFDCGIKILRENIEIHEKNCTNRPFQCKYCKKDIIKFKFLDNHLDKECPLYYIKCSFCGEDILKKNTENHLNYKCAKTDKKCMFSIIGCNEKISPGGTEEHLELFQLKHLELLSQFLLDINNKTQKIFRKINIIEKKNSKSLNKLKKKFEMNQKQMMNINNNDNSISYSIALDEEAGEASNDKNNKKDSDSIKSKITKKINDSNEEKEMTLLNKKKQ